VRPLDTEVLFRNQQFFIFSATIINHRGTEFTETLRIPFHPTYGVDSFRLIEEELKAEAVLA
jgi:hypothetical protein